MGKSFDRSLRLSTSRRYHIGYRQGPRGGLGGERLEVGVGGQHDRGSNDRLHGQRLPKSISLGTFLFEHKKVPLPPRGLHAKSLPNTIDTAKILRLHFVSLRMTYLKIVCRFNHHCFATEITVPFVSLSIESHSFVKFNFIEMPVLVFQ